MAGEDKREVVEVAVPTREPTVAPAKKPPPKDKKQKAAEDEMTEEDKKMKEDIELLVERMQDPNPGVVRLALNTLSLELKAATSSMTSVPKPLKFIRPFLNVLATHYQQLSADSDLKSDFAMILSVICTTCADPRRLTLYFCLEGCSKDVSSWGYEYLRNLSSQVASAYAELVNEKRGETSAAPAAEGTASTAEAPATAENAAAAPTTPAPKVPLALRVFVSESLSVPLPTLEQLHALVDLIVPFYIAHNAECDAVDLLAEVDRSEQIALYLDSTNYTRVISYLLATAKYAVNREEYVKMMTVCYDILLKQEQYFDALRVALKLYDLMKVKNVVESCPDSSVVKQLALLMARQRVDYPFEDEELVRLNANERLSFCFRQLAKEVDVLEPKDPEDVYKTHLEDQGRRPRMAVLDSAMQNLASTFVNAFVNAGFGTDKLMSVEGSSWLYKNKDHGMLSASASLGAISLWDVDGALAQIDKHQYSSDANIKAGALLGFGVSACNVRHECDAALALLKEHLEETDSTDPLQLNKLAAVIGIGCAYAGSSREDVMELLTVIIVDGSCPVEVCALACVSLGLCFVGSASTEAAEAVIAALMDRAVVEKGLDSAMAHFFSVGLGLLFLGTGDACEAVLLALQAIPCLPFASAAQRIVEGLAAAGSGDVLKVQKFLAICAQRRDSKYWIRKQEELDKSAKASETNGADTAEEKPSGASVAVAAATEAAEDDEDRREDFDQAVSVLNVALVAFAEDIGAEMALRTMDHLLQYADIHQRRAVPLAIALHSPSNPKPALIDLLSKLSHDADADVALNAIFALGILGAGTNHARIASLLRQLASYYGKDTNALFVVRLAQGLLHLGKGLLTINPIHSDRFLVNNVALASLCIVMHACLHMRDTILSRFHFMLYYIFPAVQPRMLLTVCETAEAAPPSTSVAVVTNGEAKMEEEKPETSGAETVATEEDGLHVLCVNVRVGEAVDVVGQVGRQPKTITASQTHTSPVLLNFSERAELATDEYIPLARVLEGIVILKKNPDPKKRDS